MPRSPEKSSERTTCKAPFASTASEGVRASPSPTAIPTFVVGVGKPPASGDKFVNPIITTENATTIARDAGRRSHTASTNVFARVCGLPVRPSTTEPGHGPRGKNPFPPIAKAGREPIGPERGPLRVRRISEEITGEGPLYSSYGG